MDLRRRTEPHPTTPATDEPSREPSPHGRVRAGREDRLQLWRRRLSDYVTGADAPDAVSRPRSRG